MRVRVPVQGTLYVDETGHRHARDEDPVLYSLILRKLLGDAVELNATAVSWDDIGGTVEIEVSPALGAAIQDALGGRDADTIRRAFGLNWIVRQI